MTIGIECRVVTVTSAGAQKLGYSALKAKQIDVIMRIVSERDVFTILITRYGESMSYGHLLYTYDEAVVIFSVTSSRYHVATGKTQRICSSHCCMRTCIIMRIPPTTVMQLSRSLEIPVVQAVAALVPFPFPDI